MGYIYIDKKHDDDDMRQNMRRSMRGGYYVGTHPMMRGGDTYEHGYRMGYRHGWEDSEEEDMEFRRARDSRGRYV